ncbi:MAG: outer membrane lipoprotein chaperone LolA [Gammaproteobacteria bacterium]|nr:outer membrane lipoprotein chaperone LolA [Gammaproteobacteria bacterium]
MGPIRTFLLLAVALSVARAAPAATGTEALDNFLSDLRTLESEFHQTLYDENLKKLEESRGLLFLERPNRFRWDYRQPNAQLIVSDGDKVWLYDRELAQVTVRKIDDALGATPALVLSSREPLEKNFEVSDLGSDQDLIWVGLKPRHKEASFAHIRLGFADGELRRMELTDNFGQLTKLEFSNMIRNAPIISDAFRFSPPAGVDVIGER